MLWQLFLIVFLIWIFAMRSRQKRLLKKCKITEIELLNVPIFGQALSLYGDYKHHAEFLLTLASKCKQSNKWTMGAWLMNWLFIGTGDPDNAEFILKQSSEKGIISRVMRLIVGNGSIFAPVQIWRPRRKIIVPMFAPKYLTMFMPVFVAHSENMANHIAKEVGNGTFSLWRYVASYTFDSSCENNLDVDIDTQSNPHHPFLTSFDSGLQLSAARLCAPWLFSEMIYQLHPDYKKQAENKRVLMEFIRDALKLKRNKSTGDNDKEENKKLFFLELLAQVKDGQTLNEEEQVEEALVMMLASVDTTAVSICTTAIMMAVHPEVQDKVYQELKEIFGDSERPVTADDLPQMQYLEYVIKETLRMYPPVPIVERYMTEQCVLPSGEIVPANSSFIVSIWSLHHNPNFWGPDVDTFRPERFREPLKHPSQFMPFSGGPRSCIGYKYAMMSAKTVLSTLLRRYRFVSTPDISTTTVGGENHPFLLKFDIMLKDGNNFPIRIELRNK